ncbi:uncharacterized protein LOC126909474 isoform X2 [Daktulosphaira vitifoliae]|uniref:uncharacterized protein LOC126909474 isoform X2 n=1 Tax=Daktulosphaira vitifoliae TaxID=58002 RepID=UPI0021A97D51|nr:uncharacterized protein LOC126909474 isoform X2 [Daktulosphaira vitifoliae]
MFLNKLKLVFFFIQTINQSICVDLNNITHEDIETLKMEYPNIHYVILQQHPYYIQSKNEVLFCPLPYSHVVDDEDIPYEEGLEIINKTLTLVVSRCVNKKNYKLAYTIFLNAIESMVFTFMYRFCEFAIEMNKQCAEISFYLENFSEKLAELIPKINREWISPEPHECILDVYKNHKSKEFKFNKININYKNALLNCMKLMENKVHFLKEPNNISMNNMDVKANVLDVTNTVAVIREYTFFHHVDMAGHVKVYEPLPPRCILDGREARCIKCRSQVTDDDDDELSKSYIMIPCGHGWYCENCIEDEKVFNMFQEKNR